MLVRVAGSHFLWKMVRRMVGVLAAVRRRRARRRSRRRWLAEPTQAGGEPGPLTAPAAGLFLERVFYEGDAWPEPLRPPVAIR